MDAHSSRGRMARRRFLRQAAVGGLTLVAPSAVRAVDANGKLELGIIGCGGRGKWIGNLFQQNSNTRVVALADYFQDRVDDLRKTFGVEPARCHTGLKGYLKLLEGKLDAVAIESPPYFHPEHAAAAVDAGKHVFIAKPIAVDVPGCQAILEAGKRAEGKLSFLVDFQTRNNEFYREAAKRVKAGALGQIVCGQVYCHTPRLGRGGGPTNTAEERLRRWVFDIALSGDIIVEQNIHVLDVATWFLDANPIRAYGTGGRKARTDVGNCWDHFCVTYWFPNDVLMQFSSSQFSVSYNDYCVRLYGSEGTLDTHYGGDVWIKGVDSWPGGNTGPIFTEGAVNNIKDFCRSLETKQYLNNAADSVRSNLTSILGRTAAYEGRMVTWDEMLNANVKLDAKLEGLRET